MNKYVWPVLGKFRLPLILSTVFLSGCLNVFFNKVDNYLKVGENSHVGIRDVHVPANGEQASIYDPETSKMKEVIFGDVYAAASGRKCSKYYSIDSREVAGITCLNDKGVWISISMSIITNQI